MALLRRASKVPADAQRRLDGMSGPEHYREAERLLASLYIPGELQVEVSTVLAEAQIHATLALAHATAVDDSEWLPAARREGRAS